MKIWFIYCFFAGDVEQIYFEIRSDWLGWSGWLGWDGLFGFAQMK